MQMYKYANIHTFKSTQSIYINSSKFFVYFTRKNLLFLFYTSTFIKHPHQFIYFTHLFNKIFIILLIFIIHSLTVLLSHRPTTTITTIIRNQRKIRSIHTYPDQPDQPKPPHLHASTYTQINPINPDPQPPSPSATISHQPNQPRPTYLDQPRANHTQINPQPKSTQTKQTHTNQDRPTP